VPFEEKGFFGSPNSNSVFIAPTAHAIVSLVERPFFLVMLDDIELVSIERVEGQIKNFDMVIIFRDYNKPVKHIDNIPKTNLAQIKEWLNSLNVLFIEGGAINIKWDKYLKTIVEDPEEFIKQGGWSGFMESESEAANSSDEEKDDDEFTASEDEESDDDEFDDEEFDEEDDEDDDEDDDEEQYEEDDYDEDEEDNKKNKKRK
jgi:nucleosome binding factor SPN SPT16 subunit